MRSNCLRGLLKWSEGLVARIESMSTSFLYWCGIAGCAGKDRGEMKIIRFPDGTKMDKLYKKFDTWLRESLKNSDEEAIEFLITFPEEDLHDVERDLKIVLEARFGNDLGAWEKMFDVRDSPYEYGELINGYLNLLGFAGVLQGAYNTPRSTDFLPGYNSEFVIVRIED